MTSAAAGSRSAAPVLELTGTGFCLPGPAGVCRSRAEFWRIVADGICCLTPFELPGLPLRLAGQVHGFDVVESAGIDARLAGWASRPARLAIGAVHQALADAALHPSGLDERSVIILASLQFSYSEAERHLTTYSRYGAAGLKIDYWLNGTCPSVLGTVCKALGLECPTLSITGSCNAAARALHVALTMFRAGEIDRAVIVGADVSLDPVFVASTTYESRHGFRPASLSADPSSVRPHDEVQEGNATGEGAVAIVLETPEAAARRRALAPGNPVPAGLPLRLYARTSRRHGEAPIVSGEAGNIADDVAYVLAQAGATLADVGFVNGYAEGNRSVEDHFCDAVQRIRKRLSYPGAILLTNQEAAFGHIAGISGLIKVVSSALMLDHGLAGPSVNCRKPYHRLAAEPVTGGPVAVTANLALTLSAGAGGDATTVLVEHLPRQGKDRL
ncbi:MAG: hypothetical protein JOY82_05770 [Streptosporangiaceae bacterium]|nr:hypothetical protein [Streptosporangiaceae bacterium]MBV9854017.1 hypothetical protein [Streptosporangiaceae bacterium]